jgi:hypothetical protein
VSQVWLLPLGAEPIARRGEELVYATGDGVGQAQPLGGVDVALPWWAQDLEIIPPPEDKS